MLLVPRQLARSGMTGNVPYYGGRFTPAQAYAAAHPPRPLPPSPPPPAVPPAAPPAAGGGADHLAALQHLLDAGIISPDEYRDLRARVTP